MNGVMVMNSMLEYKGYHATIEFDADDDIFVGKVFGIADSLNFLRGAIFQLAISIVYWAMVFAS